MLLTPSPCHKLSHFLGPLFPPRSWRTLWSKINEDQVCTTKRQNRNGHHNKLAEIGTRTQQSVQTFISFCLLNKVLRFLGIVMLVEFSKYLGSFSMIWSGIRYIWHKKFGLHFFGSPCICQQYLYSTLFNIFIFAFFYSWGQRFNLIFFTSMISMERLANFSDEVTEGRSSANLRWQRNGLNEVVRTSDKTLLQRLV